MELNTLSGRALTPEYASARADRGSAMTMHKATSVVVLLL